MASTGELGLFVPPEKERELQELGEIEEENRGRVTRRMAFRWIGWLAIMGLLAEWTVGFITGFFVPKRLGAFGGNVAAGTVTDYKVGDVLVFQAGKFYITRVPEGLMALYWKCPHLGCTVPWKPTEQVDGGPPGEGDTAFATAGQFHCPCHGSQYNRYGQIIRGPAPRPMDHFPITITAGKITVATGPNAAITRAVASFSDVTPIPS